MGDDIRLEIYHDRIGLWSRPGRHQIRGVAEAQELIALVAGAYALITRVSLDWALDGWVEATESDFKGTVMGVVPDTRGFKSPMLGRGAPRCRDMRRAARVAAFVWRRPGYRLALRDVYTAYYDRGDDGFVFAYRAIEDVARAVTGHAGQLRSKDYDALASHIGVAPSRFRKRKKGLWQARCAAVHGNETDPTLLRARRRRPELIQVGRLSPVDKVLEELEQRLLGPAQVLEHKHKRPLGRERFEATHPRGERLAPGRPPRRRSRSRAGRAARRSTRARRARPPRCCGAR